MAILQLQVQGLVGDNQGSPEIRWFEGTSLFEGVLSVLDGLDVLMDCGVRSDLVAFHLSDQLGFG